MVSFTFPGIKFFLIMGIAELVLGVLLIAGIMRGRRSGLLARIIGGVVLIALGVVFIGLRRFGEIRIDEGRMHLKVPFQRNKVIRTEEIISVREVNIARDKEFRPVWRIAGGAVGDIRTGWFKLSCGKKAFLTLKGVRALYIETSLGFPVLVGTPEFEEFEAAFIDYVYQKKI